MYSSGGGGGGNVGDMTGGGCMAAAMEAAASTSSACSPSPSACAAAQQQQPESIVITAAHYLQYEMPDEVLLTIFSYVLEQDLCRLALVCKRFNTIANDSELWKRLYQSVFEYDLPLFNPEPCRFTFVKPDDADLDNPWKESFRQLNRGLHVRPGYQERRYRGRNITYFNTVQAALDCVDERTTAAAVLGGAGATATGEWIQLLALSRRIFNEQP